MDATGILVYHVVFLHAVYLCYIQKQEKETLFLHWLSHVLKNACIYNHF